MSCLCKKKKTINVHVTNCSTCAFSCFNESQCTPQWQTQKFIKLKICCHRNKTTSLRWPVPIYMRVGYVIDSRFSYHMLTSSMPLWYDMIMIVNKFPYVNNNYYPQVANCSWACDKKVRHLEYIIVREGFHCSWKLDGEVFSN